jgi:hypothetical protein
VSINQIECGKHVGEGIRVRSPKAVTLFGYECTERSIAGIEKSLSVLACGTDIFGDFFDHPKRAHWVYTPFGFNLWFGFEVREA